ncbi:MAG: DUF2683 family protein [Candidatus ainarchaeum sp.]|nr:DUF2683 family protein [Candidatus ainarchaeum sp.]
MSRTVTMNLKAEEYTNRVLGVIKEKYGLNDKSQALNKFAQMFGEEFVEREVKEEIIKEVIASCDRHIKKYGFKTMTTKELDDLCKGE